MAAPRKRKLSRTPAAKAARARRRRIAELEAESLRLSEEARKLEARRRRNRNRRQRERRAEQKEAERIAAETPKKPRDERELAIEWLRAMTPPGFALELVEPEVAATTPWAAVGKLTPPEALSYAELHPTLRAWRDDLILEAKIHPQRIAQIRIVYVDPADERGAGDSIVSHTGPWELVISEAAGEIDPDKRQSLANRYKDTTVTHFYVYFAGELATSGGWIPSYQR